MNAYEFDITFAWILFILWLIIATIIGRKG
jgi:hypothetical protein